MSQTGLEQVDTCVKRKVRSTSPKANTRAPHSFPKTNSQQKQDQIDHLKSILAQKQREEREKRAAMDMSDCSDQCRHTNGLDTLQGQKICNDCGMIVDDVIDDEEWRWYGSSDNKHSSDPSRVQVRKVAEKSIRKDLEKLGFSQEVINIADQLYLEVTKGGTRRGNIRKSIMLGCVYEAYKILNKVKRPEYLQSIFGIDKKELSHGITAVQLGRSKHAKIYVTAADFIPQLCETLALKQEFVAEVLELYRTVCNDPILSKSYPQSVSAGCIFHTLKKKNIDITAHELGKALGMSEITVSKKANEIEEVINAMEAK